MLSVFRLHGNRRYCIDPELTFLYILVELEHFTFYKHKNLIITLCRYLYHQTSSDIPRKPTFVRKHFRQFSVVLEYSY